MKWNYKYDKYFWVQDLSMKDQFKNVRWCKNSRGFKNHKFADFMPKIGGGSNFRTISAFLAPLKTVHLTLFSQGELWHVIKFFDVRTVFHARLTLMRFLFEGEYFSSVERVPCTLYQIGFYDKMWSDPPIFGNDLNFKIQTVICGYKSMI